MDVDAYIERGLFDPSAGDAAERLALLDYLAEQGVTIEEIVDADRGGRLLLAAAETVIRQGRERLTLAEASARAGVDPVTVRRVWLADGFPDPEDAPVFSEADVAVFPLIDVASSMMGEESLLEVARVMGASLARLAEAEVAVFAHSIGAPLVQEAVDDVTIARSVVAVAGLIAPLAQVLDVVHRHHVEAAIRRLGYTREGLGLQPTETPMAIGFADLAGYTALSRQLSTEELGQLLGRFDATAYDTITALYGRVVKLIGDEVMFAARSAAIACEIAIALRTRLGAVPELPATRIGLAYGTVLTRDGDYYGPVVNHAARAASVAGSGRTLVDEGVHAAASRATTLFTFEPAGSFELKGFDDPVPLYELRVALAAPADAPV